MPLPAEAPPLWDESSNQRLSHLDTPLCMHFNHQEGYPKVHSSSIFWRETSYAQSTLSTGNTSYTLTHTFKVSVCSLGALHQLYSYFYNIPYVYLVHCVHMTKV